MRNTMKLQIALIIALLSPLGISQTTHLVPAQFATIQGAINFSSPGDTILVDPGTYSESLDFTGKAITLRGNGDRSQIIVGGASTVLTFATGELTNTLVEGLTISGGQGANGTAMFLDGGAGGVFCDATSPTIRDCVIENNTGGDGFGGIAVGGDGGGGAFHCINGAAPRVENCVIRNNLGGHGGLGVLMNPPFGNGGAGGAGFAHSVNASPYFAICSVTDNQGGPGGNANPGISGGTGGTGALYADNSLAEMHTCLLARNAGGAGGVAMIGGISIENLGGTGGVYGFGSPTTLVGCTITKNVGFPFPQTMTLAPGVGGIDMPGIAHNCIINHNFAALQSHNNILGGPGVTHSIITGIPFVGTNIVGDPSFIDFTNDDYRVMPCSFAVDWGSSSPHPLTATDLLGNPRVLGSAPDSGCFELPDVHLRGSCDDLWLRLTVNGSADLGALRRSVDVGDSIGVCIEESAMLHAGSPALLIAELYQNGAAPGGPVTFPKLHISFAGHLNLGPVLVSNPVGPACAPGNPSFTVISGLTGWVARFQGLILSTNPPNGAFSLTEARDLILP